MNPALERGKLPEQKPVFVQPLPDRNQWCSSNSQLKVPAQKRSECRPGRAPGVAMPLRGLRPCCLLQTLPPTLRDDMFERPILF